MELNRSDKNGKRYCQSCLITSVLKKMTHSEPPNMASQHGSNAKGGGHGKRGLTTH